MSLPTIRGRPLAAWVDEMLVATARRPSESPVTIVPDPSASVRGATSRILRVHATTDEPPLAMVKIAAGGDAYQRSRREALVLARLADGLGVRVPALLAADHPGPDAPVVLLLEAVAGRPGDLERGGSAREVERTLDAVATLHARWASAAARAALPDDLLPRWGAGTENAARPHARRAARYRRLLPRFLAAHPVPTTTRAHLERLADGLEARLAAAAALPVTIIHGDVHLENLLFAPPDDEPVLLDWQSASVGPAAYDVALFLATAVAAPPLAETFDALVTRHHAALVAAWSGDAPPPSLAAHRDAVRAMLDLVLVGTASGYGNRPPASITTAERAALSRALAPTGPVALAASGG